VTDIGGNVYVTYAPSGHAAQTTAGLGDGAVAVFTESGQLELSKTLLGGPHTPLASPWGVVVAPSDWGQFSGDLLVGNFSNLHSEINAFDPKTGRFEGTISISAGSGNTPGGLWDLTFGGGGSNGSPSTLYFTDGIAGETHVFSARSRAWGCPLRISLVTHLVWHERRPAASRLRLAMVLARPQRAEERAGRRRS
jgi:uncharacterized protein (TIGR03118 family)